MIFYMFPAWLIIKYLHVVGPRHQHQFLARHCPATHACGDKVVADAAAVTAIAPVNAGANGVHVSIVVIRGDWLRVLQSKISKVSKLSKVRRPPGYQMQ